MTIRFSTIARSDVGLVREGNEDCALISDQIVAVADGMGGHAGGEVASQLAITTLQNLAGVLAAGTVDDESAEDLLMNISFAIDHEIASRVRLEPELTGMGTTLTALHVSDNSVELLHIGDSRCYQWNGKKLKQLSYDHTVMQELLDQGRLTPEEVITHPQRSMLTQALMGDNRIDPVLNIFPAKVGDHFLLCSDGLTNLLSDHEITTLIKDHAGSELVDALISAVKEKGAPDNVTVLWAELVDTAQNTDQYISRVIGAIEDER
jgi:serine/threonine protein phosphatase PrpC